MGNWLVRDSGACKLLSILLLLGLSRGSVAFFLQSLNSARQPIADSPFDLLLIAVSIKRI
jgi:hypothetical protein